MANLTVMLSKFVSSNTASSSGSGTLPSNTITNPKEDLMGFTTRSGVAYQGPTIPTPSKVVKQGTEVTKDQVQTPSSQSTAPVQPSVVQSETQTPVSEPVVAPEKFSEMARTPMNEHCSAVILNKLPRKLGDPGKRCFLKTGRALINVHKGEITLRIKNEAITYNLDQTSRYSSNYNQMTANKIDVIDMACEEYSQEVLSFSDKQLKVCEAKTIKSSVDEPLEVKLKDLPPHLEYAFLEGDNKFPVIIAKELRDEEKSALIKVLKSHKRTIAWKLSDIQGINPEFCTRKILMEEDYKPAGGFTIVENEKNELIPTRLVTGWR
nr:reverse transcriptase domain-containing protein [Tanacetum cinerariifolium]